jgi:cytochrome c2
VLNSKRATAGRRPRRALFCALLFVACSTAQDRSAFVSTTHYALQASYHPEKIPRPSASGGAIASIGDHYLLVTGDGDFYRFRWEEGSRELVIRPLPYRAPINRDEFLAVHENEWESFRFRVSDLLLRQRGESISSFVSHHFWKASQRCYVIRVSSRDDRLDAFLAGTSKGTWRTLHETSPCLPLREGGRGHAFGGQQQGGRMAWLDDDELLLTVGDHEYDGWNGSEIYPQDPSVSYGKIVAIDRHSGAGRILSLGHRNPQGLYIDPAGTIWSTEHGPSGGDELNRIVRGANYGWPHVSYGTEYGARVWPLSEEQGRHDGYVAPVYAWVPSIGISNLIGVEKERFPAWKGDLLIASLVGETLYRVRLREGRVIFAEPIPIGKRIRDIVEGADGRIILWTDEATVVSLEPASPDDLSDGELLFADRCASCHQARDGATHGIGPDLRKISGRRVAAAEGFPYSEALSKLGGRWSTERLDAFIGDPIHFAPGTAMRTLGVPEAEGRAAIIEYLKTLD